MKNKGQKLWDETIRLAEQAVKDAKLAINASGPELKQAYEYRLLIYENNLRDLLLLKDKYYNSPCVNP